MARKFEEGVKYYTTADVELAFPEDEVCCQFCLLCGTDYGTRRTYCMKTGEIIPEPEHMRGGMCPLKNIKKKEF